MIQNWGYETNCLQITSVIWNSFKKNSIFKMMKTKKKHETQNRTVYCYQIYEMWTKEHSVVIVLILIASVIFKDASLCNFQNPIIAVFCCISLFHWYFYLQYLSNRNVLISLKIKVLIYLFFIVIPCKD